MTRVGRLSGALLVHTTMGNEEAWFLVGDTKVPCDWAKAGFVRPAERDVKQQRFVRLVVEANPTLTGTTLVLGVAGEAAARLLGERLTIDRNGSVSERLWRLIVGDDEADEPTEQEIPAGWLADVPKAVWDIVRDAVLKCS